MSLRIDGHIIRFRVDQPAAAPRPPAGRPTGHAAVPDDGAEPGLPEKRPRPEVLVGSTYKIKTPASTHALYVTINDLVLEPGTGREHRRPFEVFINSKNLEHYQWIVALTRVISAVFRKGGDVAFLVAELESVFDPRGGHWRRGGRFMPSLIAELGDVIERHLQALGVETRPLAADQPALPAPDAGGEATGREARGRFCPQCSSFSLVVQGGCATCLSCGDSKCS